MKSNLYDFNFYLFLKSNNLNPEKIKSDYEFKKIEHLKLKENLEINEVLLQVNYLKNIFFLIFFNFF